LELQKKNLAYYLQADWAFSKENVEDGIIYKLAAGNKFTHEPSTKFDNYAKIIFIVVLWI